MSWIDRLDDNHFLRSLFPDAAPSLAATPLHEVQLEREGPTLALRFDLSEYPSSPPVSWRSAGSNTVQVRLLGIGIRALTLTGWSHDNVGRLSIEGTAPLLRVTFESEGCRIDATLEHVRVDRVSAYLDGARTP